MDSDECQQLWGSSRSGKRHIIVLIQSGHCLWHRERMSLKANTKKPGTFWKQHDEYGDTNVEGMLTAEHIKSVKRVFVRHVREFHFEMVSLPIAEIHQVWTESMLP